MNITKIEVGELQCNCYLLEKDNNCLIIDPGSEYSKIKQLIQDKKITGILLTQHPYDHIGCVNNLIKDYNIPIYDYKNLKEGTNQISTFTFKMIKTYGHTMDSISFYFKEENIMFTGDFLFYNTIGRYDFPESNIEEMKKSIDKIKKYSNNITIYPGHGPKTNLSIEKKHNPYLKKKKLLYI